MPSLRVRKIHPYKKVIPFHGKKTRLPTPAPKQKITTKRTNKMRLPELCYLGMPNLRITPSGLVKATQLTKKTKAFLKKNPALIRDFLEIIGRTKVFGTSRKNGLTLSIFDPKDESGFHSALFLLNYKGKKFFVKELLNPAIPFDAHTQYILHQKLSGLNKHLKQFNAKIIEYDFAWQNKKASYLVGDFIPGIMLEKWLTSNPQNLGSETYQQFLKTERFLKKIGVKDVTTRNAILNPKTKQITFIDLHPFID